MLFLCRAIPIKEDSRARRYVDLLKKNHIPHKVISWGSDNPSEISPRFIPRFRDKKLINLFLIILFNFWLFFYLLFHTKRDDLIFSIDLDTRFASFLLQIFRKISVIFDIADPFCLSRLNGHLSWINKFEGYLCNKSILSIFPSKDRSTLYKLTGKFLVIENVPDIDLLSKSQSLSLIKNQTIVLGYFGSLEPQNRLLEKLTSVVIGSKNFQLVVGGAGGLDSYFEEIAIKYPEKIKYVGKFEHSQLQDLLSVCHVNVAMYSLKKMHHRYVASNKQFEHLLFRKPCLTNKGTSLSKFLELHDTGWIIPEENICEESLIKLIISRGYLKKIANCDAVWNANYKNYWLNNKDVNHLLAKIKGISDDL